jgi:hypothetical protein
MHRYYGPLAALIALALLAGCGSSSPTSTVAASSARGTLVANPPLRIASLSAADLRSQLAASTTGSQLLLLTGAPACGVDFYDFRFWTVGGADETTQSSAALMVPTGAAPACSGARPMLLYAHGTQVSKQANIADITNPSNTEGALIAAMFAAQGYIVVAPNYAGYDISTLGYHPFLDATQQSGEMMDALAAARTALPGTFAADTLDNGQLFISGYSEGGHVAMATLRALEAAGNSVTAAAPMSGPYALEAFGDAVFFGQVNIGSTEFAPLLTTSYQHEYGNIYTTPADVYTPTYATGIDTLLPSTLPIATLFQQGRLPQSAMFDSTVPVVSDPTLQGLLDVPSANPVFAAGFGEPALINNDFRLAYATDAYSDPDGATLLGTTALAATEPVQPLRRAFYLNDMRYGSWAPSAPTLMCGGDKDPTVFFNLNTGTMAAFWSGLPAGLITVVDVDAAPSGAFAAVQTAFQAAEAAQLQGLETIGGLTAAAAHQQLLQSYHSDVAPFCALAARSFFSQFVAE